jgi:SAM-dependent methyltransferase
MTEGEARYDAVAAWYAARAGESWVAVVVREHLAWLAPEDAAGPVLDVCCGEGWVTRELSARGFVVSGVDCSAGLLAIARERDPSGTYLHGDAQVLAGFGDAAFDGALCVMAAMDVPDIDAMFGAVRRMVRDGGWFSLVITHPAFEAPHADWAGDGARTIGRYLTEGEWRSGSPEGVRYRVGAWHRTISTYVMAALDAGWRLEGMAEPRHVRADNPNADIPRLLLMRFRAGS